VHQKSERWTGRIDFAFVQKALDGRSVADFTGTLRLNLLKESYLHALKHGLLFHRRVPVNAEGRSLRIVARDAPSGLAGSVTVPLDKVAAFAAHPKAN
jgi:hypothetical protein